MQLPCFCVCKSGYFKTNVNLRKEVTPGMDPGAEQGPHGDLLQDSFPDISQMIVVVI